MNTHDKIRIYVGTYAKYNDGSIYGKWLTLNDYKTESEFWAACRALHADERDPEFMFQDWECPDELGGCITESYINFKPIFEYLAAPVREDNSPAGDFTAAEMKASRAEMVRVLTEGGAKPDTVRYYEKSNLCAVRLTGGELLPIEKPRLETSFCFGHGYSGISSEEDYQSAEAARQDMHKFDSFLEANLRGLREDLAALEAGKLKCYNCHEYTRSVFVRQEYCRGLASLDWRPAFMEKRPTERDLNLDDLAILARAKRAQIANLEKRCRAWWKRFGAEHLHTWTYLVD